MSKLLKVPAWIIGLLLIGLVIRALGGPIVGSLVSLLPSSGGAAAGDAWEIVPGVSVGPIRIRMTSMEVLNVLGAPEVYSGGFRDVWKYDKGRINVVFVDGEVYGVQYLKPGRLFRKGRMLSSNIDVLAALGEPDSVTFWTEDQTDKVTHVVYVYEGLGVGVMSHPKTGAINGYIIVEARPPRQ